MFDSLGKIEAYKELRRELKKAPACFSASGCMDSQKLQLAAGLSADYRWTLYIAADDQAAADAMADLKCFSDAVFNYPAKDLLFFDSDIKGGYIENQRMEAIRHLMEDERGILVAPADALMDRIPAREAMDRARLKLSEGMLIDTAKLNSLLNMLGYERTAAVEAMGEYAIRGGIADIYPMASEAPYRIEFFGDEIDTIRSFDTLSQRSIERIESIELYPAGDSRLASAEHLQTVSLLDYFDAADLIIMDDPVKLKQRMEAVESELAESLENRQKNGLIGGGAGKDIDKRELRISDIMSADETLRLALSKRILLIAGLNEAFTELQPVGDFRFNTAAVGQYKDSFDMLISDIRSYQKKGYRITVLTPSRTRASRLAEELRGYEIKAFCPDEGSTGELKEGETEVVAGSLRRGFVYADIKYVLFTESDMFGMAVKRKRRRKFASGERLNSLGELNVGDYVVHENHGIGIYKGIEHIEREGIGKDYIRVEYSGGDSLYIPATKLDLIQKYASAEAKQPKINKLGGTEWHKTKQRVTRAVQDIARDLIKLYASRLNAGGYRYSPDTVWQTEFEEMFPYEETEDQLNTIAAVKADMEGSSIMDRLVCGDVGYGKTEIAIRAAFKAVQDSKQVALLVPTTILAQQHYNTFKSRLEGFPVEIALMSRFRTSDQNKKTAEKLKQGGVDIVIGTHRLLSKDVGFKDLGLLIIDEEQRFGVAHKEKIKQLKTNVDVLSLTATPIPRTLHMSLSGIRDLSILEEPPFDRVPIQTYVLEYNDELVREAINRELSRNGQVFYVYNRVKNIEEKCSRLRALLPNARIEYAHGQMKEQELEEIMLEFVNGEIDVLIATTIIETGLDIPNANTLIVDGAENMGLSQLYQLRGRVGRSNKTAYAFFMYKRDKILSEEAEKRLKAIREFTEFGAGIKIAMRDLEIRGAGNVLGAEQHGEMQAVGYDLYCKLLSDAVRLMRGGSTEAAEEKPEFETGVDCDADAFIPDSYISDEYQKLDIYKKISEISTEAELHDMEDELLDRYGDVPREVEQLLLTALLKSEAHRAYITEITVKDGSMVIKMFPQADIDIDVIPKLIEEANGRLKLVTGANPKFIYTVKKGESKSPAVLMEYARSLAQRLTKKEADEGSLQQH